MNKESNDKRTWWIRIKTRIYRPGPLIFFFAIAFSALVYVIYRLLVPVPEPPSKLDNHIRLPANHIEMVYEEMPGDEFEEQSRQIDYALLMTLRTMKVDQGRLELLDVQERKFNSSVYHYQSIQIPLKADREKFVETLTSELSRRVPGAVLTSGPENVYSITLKDVLIHTLSLAMEPQVKLQPVAPGPKLAIVIDDIGENLEFARRLAKLDFPIVFSVWPSSTHREESCRLAREAGRDLMIHLPMQPQGYPEVDPGPDALFVAMKESKVKEIVRRNLAKIPDAIGVNNHMGSRFTESWKGMSAALSVMREKGLFFLDSKTTSKSVCRSVASNLDVVFFERDIFLDNIKNVEAIVHQIRKAERLARKNGQAVAIGHPNDETLTALEQWARERDGSVKVVGVSALAPK